MDYDAHIHRHGAPGGLVMFRGTSFASIKAQARDWVENGSALRVEIFDSERNLVFHMPRVMRRA